MASTNATSVTPNNLFIALTPFWTALSEIMVWLGTGSARQRFHRPAKSPYISYPTQIR